MGIRLLLVSIMILVVYSCQLTSSSKAESSLNEDSGDIEIPLSNTAPSAEDDEMANRPKNHSIGEAQGFELVNYVKSENIDIDEVYIYIYDSMKVSIKHRGGDLDDIIRQNSGFHNMVIDRGSASELRSYLLDTTFDMGDFDLWLFKSKNSNIIIVELYDYYSSVFFPYILVDDRLLSIGHFVIHEPEVEDVGIQKKDIEIVWDGEKFITTTFLGGVEDGVFEFEWADAIEQKIIY